ncbi:hypothetical protein [Microbacterium murale]|uniref:Uncharacterized protein n=1 Tax=Microbacterium murale TaxID=1081040 RepID=A0ABU0P9Q4_9MICO|nr:hypothetical protein [Microbacterium murale]MDQ0644060.1 hypothetical protein [Microbacterium murale]
MSDLRAERCDRMVQPIVDLTASVLASQIGNLDDFDDVIRAAESVLAVAELGSYGIDDDAYIDWAGAAPATFKRIIEAAERKDKKAVWLAFADPQTGVYRVSAACQGLPRW